MTKAHFGHNKFKNNFVKGWTLIILLQRFFSNLKLEKHYLINSNIALVSI